MRFPIVHYKSGQHLGYTEEEREDKDRERERVSCIASGYIRRGRSKSKARDYLHISNL